MNNVLVKVYFSDLKNGDLFEYDNNDFVLRYRKIGPEKAFCIQLEEEANFLPEAIVKKEN